MLDVRKGPRGFSAGEGTLELTPGEKHNETDTPTTRPAREESPVTRGSRPEINTGQQPFGDRAHRRAVQETSRVVKESPLKVDSPFQSNAGQRRQANAGHSATASSSQELAEVPLATSFPRSQTTATTATRQYQTGAKRAAVDLRPPWAVKVPPAMAASSSQTTAAVQHQTDGEPSMTGHWASQLPKAPPVMGTFPSKATAEQQRHRDTEHLLTAQRSPTSPAMAALRSQISVAQQSQTGTKHPKAALATVRVEDLGAEDALIAVIGPTGSGKSTFIRAASGLDIRAVCHTLRTFTAEVQAVRFRDENGRRIVLVDMPGFDDTSKPDCEILEIISNWLTSSYKKGKILSGILYLHRITDNRIVGTPLKNIRVFQKLYGNDVMNKVWLATTMWDEVDPIVGERRLAELKQSNWRPMISQGAQVVCCRSDDDSPRRIVQQILDHKARGPLRQERMANPVDETVVRTEVALETVAVQARQTNAGHLTTDQRARTPPTVVSVGDLEMEDTVIAVMGRTGSGKSTFIRVTSGLDTHAVCHELRSPAAEVQAVRFCDERGRRVVLVDMPGFDDTSKPDHEILEVISDWLNSSHEKGKRLSGILYLHRITDNRIVGTPLRNLLMFQKLCGKDALDQVWLTTTMWDEVDPGVGERRLAELKRDNWKVMMSKGAQEVRCRSDDNSPKQIIQQILDHRVSCNTVLLQQGTADLKRELQETEGGQGLYLQLEELVERQTALLQRIGAEWKGTPDANVEELWTQYNELQFRMDDKLRQMQEPVRLSPGRPRQSNCFTVVCQLMQMY